MKSTATAIPVITEEQSAHLNEIKMTFNEYLTACQSSLITSYHREVYHIRPQIINWLVFICKKLCLTLETLFHCVLLFDKYISLSCSFTKSYSLDDINLTCIACLSLATKQEEINSNYIKFFTETILNTPKVQLYSVKDVARKEFEVLKLLKFKTLFINAYHFNKLYMELFQLNPNLKSYTKAINEEVILFYLSSEYYLSYPPHKIAMFAFKETLLSMNTCYFALDMGNHLLQQFNAFHQLSESSKYGYTQSNSQVTALKVIKEKRGHIDCSSSNFHPDKVAHLTSNSAL